MGTTVTGRSAMMVSLAAGIKVIHALPLHISVEKHEWNIQGGAQQNDSTARNWASPAQRKLCAYGDDLPLTTIVRDAIPAMPPSRRR